MQAVGGRRQDGRGEVADHEPDGERHDERGYRHAHRRGSVGAITQVREIELHSNLKHQQHQAEARQQLQGLRHGRAKDQRERIWKDQSEERGPERNTDEDLAHDGRLTDAAGKRSAHAASRDDDGQLQQREEQNGFRAVHAIPPLIEMI